MAFLVEYVGELAPDSRRDQISTGSVQNGRRQEQLTSDIHSSVRIWHGFGLEDEPTSACAISSGFSIHSILKPIFSIALTNDRTFPAT
jgi:hypothetical protein